MRTGAKGDMPVLVARSFKLTWFVELRRIVVRGDIVEHQPIAFGNLHACYFDILIRHAHEMLHRRGPADRFLNDACDKAPVRLDLGKLLRVFGKRQHRARRARRGRIMPGGGNDDVVSREIKRIERLAVNCSIGEDSCDILARILAPFLGQLLEIFGEILHRAQHDLRDLLG